MTAWTAIPEAAALLADLAANPPRERYAKGTLGPNDGALIYTGERVKKLEAIWRAEQDRLWALCDFQQPFNPTADAFSAHCRLSVQSAIATALAEHRALRGVNRKEAA